MGGQGCGVMAVMKQDRLSGVGSWLPDGSSERAWKVRLTSVKHGLKGRPARRPARRIAALNHSHLSALSGGLLLLCGGD
jgi:hypothetical protein